MNKSTAVILAAGKGTRLHPYTTTTPKPLIPLLGQSILERNLDSLLPYVSQIVIVVGHLHQYIEEKIGQTYRDIPVRYVMQSEQLGTGHAFLETKNAVATDHIICIYGDDLYDPSFFEAITEKESAIVAVKKENWQAFGVCVMQDDKLKKIVEKPTEFVSDLINIGVFKLKKSVYEQSASQSERNEFEITDLISAYAEHIDTHVIESNGYWFPIGYPWHILEASQFLANSLVEHNEGTIEPNVTIKGKLHLGKNSVIKSGTYIEGNVFIGDNSIVGPNNFLREFVVLGNNSIIGGMNEVKASIIGEHSCISHLSYIGNSIIGNHTNIGGGTITANLRHDSADVKVKIKGELIDTKHLKIGAFIGDNVKIGIHTSIYPGRKLSNHTSTLPGEIVSVDK